METDGVNCTECKSGYYAEAEGSHSCVACPHGTYTNKSVSFSSCSVCLPGTFAEEASSKCTECPKGTNTNASTGYRKCDPCYEGYIAPNEGQSTCTKCPKGHYSDFDSVECLSCSGDKWNNSGQCTPIGEIAVIIPIVILVGAGIAFIIWKTRKIGNNFKHYEMKDEVAHQESQQMDAHLNSQHTDSSQ